MVEVSAEEYDTIVNERVSHLEGWVTEVVIRQADGLMETTKRPIDIAPDGPPPIEGKRQQLSLVAGGEDPDASESKLRGGSVPVEGEFEKGDVLTLLVKVSCDEVHFIDKKDNDGYVVATTRRHIFKPLSIQRA
jgi:hypothetical protein